VPPTYGERVTLPPTAPDALPRTLRALRDSGHRHRTVKAELRANLLAAMADGTRRFEGIVGFDETVLPEVERALLAGHDLVLLGERGQGKTRLIRSLVGLLDEWTPVIAGSELNEHPYAPLTAASRRSADELGDDLPVAWLHRSGRYGEKLATPDTSVGDLIGDVDPIRVAQGRTLGDPETIHFGLVPRTNRGIFAVNELPDLAERIQVSLLNVLEERDIQVRGYQLRLPLDLDDETALVRQEARLVAEVPDHGLEVVARFARAVRVSPAVDVRSGVSARFAVAAAETVAAAALRRAALRGEPQADAVARVGDTESVVSTLRGKVEFESGQEGRETEVLAHLLRTAVAETFRAHLAGLDLSGFVDLVADGGTVETGELVTASEVLQQVGTVPGLAKVLDGLGIADAPGQGQAAAGVEMVLEGLHLTRRLAKDVSTDGRSVYGG
jgi:magnesium chelatase subunit I